MDVARAQQLAQQAYGFFQSGQWQQAIDLLEEVCRAHSGFMPGWQLLGQSYYQQARYTQAINCFQRVCTVAPQDGQAHFALAMALGAAGFYQKAEVCLTRVIQLKPDLEQAYIRLAHVLIAQGRQENADAVLSELLKRAPAHTEAMLLKAQVATELGRLEVAESIYRSLLGNGANVAAEFGLAQIYLRRNQIKPAHTLIEKYLGNAAELSASCALTAAEILEKVGQSDSARALYEQLLSRPDLDDRDSATCHFAYGKWLDKHACYEQAFRVYQRANALAGVEYQREETHLFFDKLHAALPCIEPLNHKASVSGESSLGIEQALGEEPASDLVPVFIVGMPRSGTSLTEQILSAHSKVLAVGESPAVGKMLAWLHQHGHSYPECIHQLVASELKELRRVYFAQLPAASDSFAPKGESYSHVVDKMPDNFKHLLLIKKVFPEAKIIHVRRNPLDTCLSCYFQQFSGVHDYAYDLNALADYYQLYVNWMQRSSQSPWLALHELCYEKWLSEFDHCLTELLDFCGLSWEDACCRYYESQRSIATASYDQASRPIYKDSHKRWKHYRAYIEPLAILAQ